MKRERVILGASDDPVAPDARMSVLILRPRRRARGLAVVVHGRNGAADARHMRLIASAYVARGMTVVLPDCCGSAYNASAGGAGDFSLAGHLRDAGRAAAFAIEAAADLGWAGRRIALAGHSMGAYTVGMLAASTLADRCRHLLLVSPFVSGRHQIAARCATSGDGLVQLAGEVPQALTEWPRHDLLRHARRIACPAATVVGVRDTVTPDATVRLLGAALPAFVSHTVLDGAHHSLEGGPHEPAFAAVVDALDAASEEAGTA
jgi:alpha-beta hydrolase superfamily lysophospholipase